MQRVQIRCSQFHQSFQSGVYVTRLCNENGEWEQIDFSDCTMRNGSTPIIILEYNHNISNLNSSSIVSEVSVPLYVLTFCVYTVLLNHVRTYTCIYAYSLHMI